MLEVRCRGITVKCGRPCSSPHEARRTRVQVLFVLVCRPRTGCLQKAEEWKGVGAIDGVALGRKNDMLLKAVDKARDMYSSRDGVVRP